MAALTLARATYHDKVYGGWLGKSAGVTLGAPLEGQPGPHSVQFYDPIPGQATASDALDFQLVWLHALREHGPDLTADNLAAEWLDHLTYPWDEYGYAAYNLRRDLRPPITGAFNNWFQHGTSALNRTELWAMIAPGAPQVAAAYACQDSRIDHAGEGVWSAMFWAAIESAAFLLSDALRLLDVGLAIIPKASRTARAVQIARECHQGQKSLAEARSRILEAVGHENYTDAPQNLGFIVAGWLYGLGDFGASLCTVVNLGGDTGGNAAALGALMGIVRGRSGLPAEWIQPIGEAVVLGWGVVDLGVERTIAELTDHVVEIGAGVLAAKCPHVALADAPESATPAPSESGSPPVAALPAESPAPPPAGEVVVPKAGREPLAQDTPPPIATDLAELNERIRRLELDAPAPPPAAPMESAPAPDIPLPSVAPAALPVPTEPPATLPDAAFDWQDSAQIKPLLVAPSHLATFRAGDFVFEVDYGPDGPAIVPNRALTFTVAIRNLGGDAFMGHVQLRTPDGWQVAVPGAQGQRQMLARGGMARYGFVVRVPDTLPLQPRNVVTLMMTPEKGRATRVEIPLLGGACWWFVGPFQNFAEEGFERVFEVEDRPGFGNEYLGRGQSMIRWQKMGFAECVMPLESIFRGLPGVAYGVTTLHAPRTTEARLTTHTNDGLKVWLNGQRILQWHSHDAFRPTLGSGPTCADVTLKAGDNRVMVKVVRCGAPLEFCFALTDRQNRPLSDVTNTRW